MSVEIEENSLTLSVEVRELEAPTLLNDVDMARWFDEEVFEGAIRFNEALGWHQWDGRVWRRRDKRPIRGELSRTLKIVERRARLSEVPQEIVAALKRRFSNSSLNALLAQLEVQTYTEASFFEPDPSLLNVQNGIVDLRSGELRPHDREAGFRQIASAPYFEGACHEDWNVALSALDADARDVLQLAVGQAITGSSPPDDKLNFFYGPRAQNGKSSIVLGLEGALGDFAVFASEKVLAGTKFDHPAEKMQLFGARIAIVEELPFATLNSKLLKDITGRKVTARWMHQNPITWTATHTVFVTTNHALEFDTVDNAVRRRVRLFPFQKEFVDKPSADHHVQRDPSLRERLIQGREGQHEAILSWAIQGAILWFGNGERMPTEPEVMRAARESWEAESDVLGNFFDEFLEVDSGSWVSVVELLAAFNYFVSEIGGKEWTLAQFSAGFESRSDLEVYRSKVGRPRNVEERSIPSIPGWQEMVSKQPTAWFGMKFRAQRAHDSYEAHGY